MYPEFNGLNPDMADPALNTPNGIYAPGQGIMSLEFAFGHDEYAYLAFKHNQIALPEEGFAMLRLHSCYPWHRGGAYAALEAPGDDKLKQAVLDFNQFDLYTKASAVPDIDAVWPHYQAIIDKYTAHLPGGLLEW